LTSVLRQLQDEKGRGVEDVQGVDGYAPIFAYLGREGYEVNVELREGKQHSQKGTPTFLRESIRYAKRSRIKDFWFAWIRETTVWRIPGSASRKA